MKLANLAKLRNCHICAAVPTDTPNRDQVIHGIEKWFSETLPEMVEPAQVSEAARMKLEAGEAGVRLVKLPVPLTKAQEDDLARVNPGKFYKSFALFKNPPVPIVPYMEMD